MGVNAIFPGILQVLNASYTMGLGIAPGVAQLSVVAQATLPNRNGPLLFTDGGAGVVLLPDCLIDSLSFRYDASGQVVNFSIWDHRWRWKFGDISGRYNLRDRKETEGIKFEKSPRELAKLCLEAMGETNFNVDAMPDSLRPEVTWNHILPAQALQELCALVGCRVAWQFDGMVKIVLQGVGGPLPAGLIMNQAVTVDLPETPTLIAVVCGPTKHQCDVFLEPVGKDTDGSIKPIDELSYKPEGGWENEDPFWFPKVNEKTEPVVEVRNADKPGTASIPVSTESQLARQTVWRWYRIEDPPRGVDLKSLKPAGVIDFITSRDEILPLFPRQAQPAALTDADRQAIIDAVGGNVENATQLIREEVPLIYGIFSSHSGLSYANNVVDTSVIPPWDSPGAQYKRPFQIDLERGIVMFSEPVFQWEKLAGSNAGYQIKKADLILRIACPLLNADTHVPEAYVRARGTSTALIHTVHHPEIVRRRYFNYRPGSNDIQISTGAGTGGTVSNPETENDEIINVELDYLLDGLAQQYQPKPAGSASYIGLLPIRVDGAVTQVSWNVGPGGAFTEASLNTEHDFKQVSYKEMFFLSNFWGNRLKRLRTKDKDEEEPTRQPQENI